uniref:UDP-N-acetylglucosamine transferase subunit ALG13 n=1 Tax=Oncorhynchus kisutch TaxID=8019 RepID=A0A8C7MD33_ONCKI
MKRVFVTVGTTSFDDLFERVTSPEAVQVLKARGYQHLVLQVGRSSIFPDSDSCHKLMLEPLNSRIPPLKMSNVPTWISLNYQTIFCLETLGAGKPLLVVFNGKLMDIHQLDVNPHVQLNHDSHFVNLTYCTFLNLTETLRTMDLSVLSPFLPRQPNHFANFLDKALGVQ